METEQDSRPTLTEAVAQAQQHVRGVIAKHKAKALAKHSAAKKKPTCEADEKSKVWGDKPPCDKPQRGKGLCNSHLAQLARRGGDAFAHALAPLLGKHGRKRVDEVDLGTRVERTVADKVASLGVALGAEPGRAKYRGAQALAEGYAGGALRWAPGKDPMRKKKRTGS